MKRARGHDSDGRILALVRDWRYLTRADLAALAGFSRPRATAVCSRLVAEGSLAEAGKIRTGGLDGRWMRAPGARHRFSGRGGEVASSSGERLPLHALWVSRVGALLAPRLPDWDVVPESVLRRDWGWFYGRMRPDGRSSRLTYVPDILLYRRETGAGIRVEVQLSPKRPAHFRRLEAVSRDDFPIWLVCPGQAGERIARAAAGRPRITPVDPRGPLPPLPAGRIVLPAGGGP